MADHAPGDDLVTEVKGLGCPHGRHAAVTAGPDQDEVRDRATITIRNRKADEEVEDVDLAAVVGVVDATRTETLFMRCI